MIIIINNYLQLIIVFFSGVDVPGTAKENDDENVDLMNTYAGVTPDRSMVGRAIPLVVQSNL